METWQAGAMEHLTWLQENAKHAPQSATVREEIKQRVDSLVIVVPEDHDARPLTVQLKEMVFYIHNAFSSIAATVEDIATELWDIVAGGETEATPVAETEVPVVASTEGDNEPNTGEGEDETNPEGGETEPEKTEEDTTVNEAGAPATEGTHEVAAKTVTAKQPRRVRRVE